jgi:uncharacterized protein
MPKLTAAEHNDNEPVTIVVRRRVRLGKELLYEAWLTKLLADAARLPGYLGTTVHRPTGQGRGEYVSVFRFDSVASLHGFETSELRQRALAEVAALVEADATWEKLTGLEFWFTPPLGLVVPQPSRFRMAMVMIFVVYGLVFSIGKVVALVMSSVPLPLRLLVTITIEVFLLTYVLMPRLMRWLAPWFYPKPKENSK